MSTAPGEATRDQIMAWWESNPDTTAADVSKRFGGHINAATLRVWKQRLHKKTTTASAVTPPVTPPVTPVTPPPAVTPPRVPALAPLRPEAAQPAPPPEVITPTLKGSAYLLAAHDEAQAGYKKSLAKDQFSAAEKFLARAVALKKEAELALKAEGTIAETGAASMSEEQFHDWLRDRVRQMATPHLEIAVSEYLDRHPGLRLVQE